MRLVVFEQYRRRSLGALLEDGSILDLPAAAAAWLALVRHDPFWEREVALRLPSDVGRYLAGGLPSQKLAESALGYVQQQADARGIGGEPLILQSTDARLIMPLQSPLIVSPGATFRDGAIPPAAEREQHREFFMRNPLNVLSAGMPIPLPEWLSDEFDAAPRLAVIIGRSLSRASLREAEDAIFGYCAALEICAKGLETISWAGALFHVQYPHARTFDGALTLGPAVVSKDEIGPISGLRARMAIDSRPVYSGPIPGRWDQILEWICVLSESVTLEAGALLIPGPADDVFVQPARSGNLPVELVHDGSAASAVRVGNVITIDIEGIGGFQAPVSSEPHRPSA